MANLTPVPSWDDVFQLELTTQVLGGPGGPANSQAQTLVNRLAYLESAAGSAKLGYTPAGVGAVATTAQAKLRELVTSADHPTLQAAVTAAAGKTLRVFGTHTITSAVTVLSDTQIILEPGSVVQTSVADISHFDVTGRSNVHFRGPGVIRKTGVGTTAYVAGVKLSGASHCSVEGIEFDGMQWSGVYMAAAINCRVTHCYIHDHLGTVQDAAGVSVLGASRDCRVAENRIVSTGWHGVLIQDADATAGVVPIGTSVVSNNISGTTAYGVACYELATDDSDTLIQGNRVNGVSGVNPSGSGGAGVHVQNSGGVRVIGNVIRHVCTATSNATLTPAGVGVNNIGTGITPPTIQGNTIVEVGVTSTGVLNANAVLLAGINISSSAAGAVVTGNMVRQATALTTPTFAAFYANASSGVDFTGNKARLPVTGGTSLGIFAFANGSNIVGLTLGNNDITGGTNCYIQITTSGGYTTSGLSISGGSCRGGSAACRGLQMDAVTGYSVTGLQIDAGAEALFLNGGCTNGRFSSSRFESSGATNILTAGACTNSLLDASNFWGTVESKMNNAGTGLVVEWMGGTAAPVAGTWSVNSRTIRGTQTVGQPKAWVSTVAGAPGTWVSEGNL